jgi:outer membrane protein OmpA-like peptidoglycan-associated protein
MASIMTSPILAHRRVVLPLFAGLALVSLPATAQQPGYGTSVVGAYNPYTQAGPGQTSGRAYGAPPVAPYPPAYGPGAVPAPPPRFSAGGQPPAGQVGAYNPWRQQQSGGGAPGFYAPSAAPAPAAADPGANLPPPPAGPIRSRLLSIPETGNPVGASGPFTSVPYTPRRSGAARPAVPPRTTVAAAPAPAPVASGGMTDGPPPAPTPTPRITNPPRAAPPPPPALPTPVTAPKPASADPVVAAAAPEPPKPAPPPAPVVAKPPEATKPAPAVVVERPAQTAAVKPVPAVEPKPAPAAPVVATAPPEPPKQAPPPAPVVAKPPDAPKPAQTAAPPPAPAKPAAIGAIRVTFEANSPALSTEARAALDRLAAELIANPERRTTLKAYSADAGGPETRRLSLARGLAVRAYLIDKGVARERLDVQALGASADGGPADRVDAVSGAGT